MKYFIGPWKWNATDKAFVPPATAIGAIDLGTLPAMAIAGSDRAGCLCWTDGAPLPSEYDVLGMGDAREIKRTEALAAKIGSVAVGRAKPDGDTLDAMILDMLVGQSDPDGGSSPRSMEPGTDGWMDLWMPGHGKVRGVRFEWGRSPHTIKLKASLRSQFRNLMALSARGKTRDPQQHRRVLDMWCEKYGIDTWGEFVPQDLQKDVPGRLPHATTISDNFNRSDIVNSLGTSSAGWSWVNALFSMDLTGNKVVPDTSPSVVRAEIDLSSADHYAQVLVNISGVDMRGGAAVRFSASGLTYYHAGARNSATTTYRMKKTVAGTDTVLTDVNATAFTNGTLKTEINGSALRLYKDGSTVAGPTTDTSITGNLRTGLESRTGGTMDDFQAADLATSTILYTQLERSTRGLKRGTYQRF